MDFFRSPLRTCVHGTKKKKQCSHGLLLFPFLKPVITPKMDLLTFWKTFWKTFPSAKVVVPIPQNPQKWMMWGKGKLMNSGRREWKVNIAARLHAETYHTHNPLQKEALLATFSVLFVENMPLGLEYSIWLWIQFLQILSYCDILFGMVPSHKKYTQVIHNILYRHFK